MSDAKARLVRAGEHLFAREGIHGAQVKDLNQLAGQRNPSALHYHFGSREGLLGAIVDSHIASVDAARAEMLQGIGDSADVAELMRVVIAPLATELDSPSGRDYLRIVPQVLDADISPKALLATLRRVEAHLTHLVVRQRKERLLAMIRAVTALLAAQATQLEDGPRPHLKGDEFVENLIEMATGMLLAPTSIAG